MVKKVLVHSKQFNKLWCRGHWELQRGKLRVNLEGSIYDDSFIMDMDLILELLKKADLTLVAEQKRVHKHLRIAQPQEIR